MLKKLYAHILCVGRSIILLCSLKYWTGHHSQEIQTIRNIILPGVAKFGSMDCKDTIEIRVFFQCQNPYEIYCVFITEGARV